MSLIKYAAPLTIELQPSRRLRWGVMGVCLATLVLILFLPLSGWWTVVVMAIVLAGLCHTWRVHLYRSSRFITTLVWDVDDKWTLITIKGQSCTAHLQPNIFVHPYLVILNFRIQTFPWRRTVLLLADNVNVDSFRHLRVRLRISSASVLNKTQ